MWEEKRARVGCLCSLLLLTRTQTTTNLLDQVIHVGSHNSSQTRTNGQARAVHRQPVYRKHHQNPHESNDPQLVSRTPLKKRTASGWHIEMGRRGDQLLTGLPRKVINCQLMLLFFSLLNGAGTSGASWTTGRKRGWLSSAFSHSRFSKQMFNEYLKDRGLGDLNLVCDVLFLLFK